MSKKVVKILRGDNVPDDAVWLKETTIESWKTNTCGSSKVSNEADLYEVKGGEDD